MPGKQFMLDGNVPISIYKRKGSRNLRLSIASTGEVRVSIPSWAPYRAGLDFARSRQDWILAQQQPVRFLAGQPIGKAHHLFFRASPGAAKPSSRLAGGTILVTHSPEMPVTDPRVQKAARDGGIRALRSQAEQLLPQRLSSLAQLHDFSYASVKVKHLKSRWGSCDQDRAIVLNLFLMQLPWKYIDYVLLHELTHTRVMRHGPDFWRAMEAVLPDAAVLRKEIHAYRPVLDGSPLTDVA